MLTPEQIVHFETFGFVILRQVFNAEEVEIMRREADEILTEDGNAGSVSDTTQGVQPFFELKPFLSTLVADDRIYEIGVDLLGPDFLLVQTEGRSRVGDTQWHGPVAQEHATRTAKIGFYLDELTRDTGCLRFVPRAPTGRRTPTCTSRSGPVTKTRRSATSASTPATSLVIRPRQTPAT